MKKLFYLLFTGALAGCAPENGNGPGKGNGGGGGKTGEAAATMAELWTTTPETVNTTRQDAFDDIQGWADDCFHTYFKNYLDSPDEASRNMEKYDDILICFRKAFDRVLEGLKNDKVEQGTAAVWMLYNMGYVVKTPSGAFAVDVHHRWGAELAPYLDFLCVTHDHRDHYWYPLMDAMIAAKKPVVSNFYPKDVASYPYKSTSPASYTVGNFKIKTAIADHNSTLRNFVTVFRVECGADTGNFSLYHTGDCSFNTSQLGNVQGPVDVLITRYAPSALAENKLIGEGNGRVQPGCILLSHILELGHNNQEEGARWTLDQALVRASKLNSDHSYVPFWGEKMIWENGKLN
jgi:hypothetical protein